MTEQRQRRSLVTGQGILAEALTLAAIDVYGRPATGGKYPINPGKQ